MKVLYRNLMDFEISKLIIVSLEQALYQAIVVVDSEEHLVWEDRNKPMQSRNLTRLRERFETIEIEDVVLRHESPYDEMVGQPDKLASNRMEVPLKKLENPMPKQLH